MFPAGFVATDQERRVRTRFQPALNAEADRIILITHRLARQFAERDATGDLLFGHRLLAGQNRLDRRRCGRGRSRQYPADQEMTATNSGVLRFGEDAIDRKSRRLNSSHECAYHMQSSALTSKS